MNDPVVVDTLAALIFVAFTFMVILAAVSVAFRVGRWQARRLPLPTLLVRDLLVFSGFSFTFLAITVARVLELPATYTRTVPWIVFTSAPSMTAMAVFLWFEFFVIGHGDED